MVTTQELAAQTMADFWQREEERSMRLIPIRRRQLHLLSLVAERYREHPRRLRPGSRYDRKHDQLLYCSTGFSRYISAAKNIEILDLIDYAVAGNMQSRGVLMQEIDMGRVHPLWVRYYRLCMDLRL